MEFSSSYNTEYDFIEVRYMQLHIFTYKVDEKISHLTSKGDTVELLVSICGTNHVTSVTKTLENCNENYY